jgi:hypothetical protein
MDGGRRVSAFAPLSKLAITHRRPTCIVVDGTRMDETSLPIACAPRNTAPIDTGIGLTEANGIPDHNSVSLPYRMSCGADTEPGRTSRRLACRRRRHRQWVLNELLQSQTLKLGR